MKIVIVYYVEKMSGGKICGHTQLVCGKPINFAPSVLYFRLHHFQQLITILSAALIIISCIAVPYCLSLICAYAIVILLVVRLWFSIHTVQRLTRGQTTLLFVILCADVIRLAYDINTGNSVS